MRQEMCLFSETCWPQSGAHPLSFSVCSGSCFSGRKSNHKPLPRTKVKIEWSCIYTPSWVFVLYTGSNLLLFTEEIKAILVVSKTTEERSTVKCSCRCLVKFPKNTLSTKTTSGNCSSSFVTFSVNMAPVGHTVHHLDRALNILNTLSNSFSVARFEVFQQRCWPRFLPSGMSRCVKLLSSTFRRIVVSSSSCTDSPRIPWKTCILFACVLLRRGETTFYLIKEINRCSVIYNYSLFFSV